MKLTQAQSQQLTRAVEVAESSTSAELVLVILPQSFSARGAAAVVGGLWALVALALVLFLESIEIEPWLAFVLVPLLGLGAVGLALVLPARLFARATILKGAVDEKAHAAFSRCGVYRTSGRTGVLVFLSLGERQARLLYDVGVVKAVPSEIERSGAPSSPPSPAPSTSERWPRPSRRSARKRGRSSLGALTTSTSWPTPPRWKHESQSLGPVRGGRPPLRGVSPGGRRPVLLRLPVGHFIQPPELVVALGLGLLLGPAQRVDVYRNELWRLFRAHRLEPRVGSSAGRRVPRLRRLGLSQGIQKEGGVRAYL